MRWTRLELHKNSVFLWGFNWFWHSSSVHAVSMTIVPSVSVFHIEICCTPSRSFIHRYDPSAFSIGRYWKITKLDFLSRTWCCLLLVHNYSWTYFTIFLASFTPLNGSWLVSLRASPALRELVRSELVKSRVLVAYFPFCVTLWALHTKAEANSTVCRRKGRERRRRWKGNVRDRRGGGEELV